MRIFQKDAYIGVDFLNKKSEIISLDHNEGNGDGFTFDIETMNGKNPFWFAVPKYRISMPSSWN